MNASTPIAMAIAAVATIAVVPPSWVAPESHNKNHHKFDDTTVERDCGDGDKIVFVRQDRLWPVNRQLQDVSVTATDAAGGEVALEITATDAAGGDGGPSHDPDVVFPEGPAATGTGSATVAIQLRSERNVHERPRKYTIDFAAEFADGSKSCTSIDSGQSPFTVLVPAHRCDPGLAVRPSDRVSTPTVEGPIGDEGIRTREPYNTTMVRLHDGWVEEEFFFSGTARSYGTSEDDRAFKSRILVRRPADPAAFNGTIVFGWNNVSSGQDNETGWPRLHRMLMHRGFASVSVAAQLLSIEASPLALKQYDPLRYGTLSHPGDDYSFDIFSQAAEAAISPAVMGELRPCVQRRLATGSSQSSNRLTTYINEVHSDAQVFDGFELQTLAPSLRPRRDLVPVLTVNSQSEVARATPPSIEGAPPVPDDSALFRLWEVAGPAHGNYSSGTYRDAILIYSHTNGTMGAWDAEDAGSWGYHAAPTSCLTDNYYNLSYAMSAALVALDDWVRSGNPPEPQPRAARDDGDGLVYDEHGNLVGGVRSPLVDAPIASYFAGVGTAAPPGADPCGQVGGRLLLRGWTRVFDRATLATLYPTPQDYLEKFDAAVETALAVGTLLPEGAAELRRRAVAAADFIATATG